MRKRLYIYVVLLIYLFSIGCAAALIGAGVGAGVSGVAWYKGELQETVSASVPRIHQAIVEVLKDLNIRISENRFDNLTSKVIAVLANDKEVYINTKSINSSTAKISIRVGVFGDKTHSMRIMDEIKKRL